MNNSFSENASEISENASEISENIIEISGLSKTYKDFSLSNLSLTLPKGCIMGFVGQNGAGKSTTIKSILNLITFEEGSIKIFGKDSIKDSVRIKEDIGVVFDELAIPEILNCEKINNILKHIYKNWNEQTFFDYINNFALPPKKALKNFSRGMRMKLQIAIALSHNAKLLILDEATAGLDPIARNEILDILLEFVENEENSILMSSHITSDLERVADYITFIDKGHILLSDEKYNITNSHAIAKGSEEELMKIPEKYVVATRKNAYSSEALINDAEYVKHTFPEFVYDQASLDDILYFYVKRTK